MAELEADCCAPAEQASCCESEQKAECCGEGHGAGCGCAAGADPPPTAMRCASRSATVQTG
jgi:hypothetical protein